MNKNEPTNTEDIIHQDAKSFQGESGVVPLAFPLLAGPGAITAVIISYQANGLVTSIISIAIVLGITYMIFRIADCATTSAISDGNWVFVKPLNSGKHEISFMGEVTSIDKNTSAESFAFPSGWNYSTTYELIIK